MQVTISINCDGDAFADDPASEVARILTDLAQQIQSSGSLGGGKSRMLWFDWHRLMDINGNTVGELNVDEHHSESRDFLKLVEDAAFDKQVAKDLKADTEHKCAQCGQPMGNEWIFGPVCAKCCRANQREVTGYPPRGKRESKGANMSLAKDVIKILSEQENPGGQGGTPDDLVIIPNLGDLSEDDIKLVDSVDWYEPDGGGPILVSAKAINYLSEADPADAGVDISGGVQLIDQVLHRWSQEDGFYHA